MTPGLVAANLGTLLFLPSTFSCQTGAKAMGHQAAPDAELCSFKSL